ncbi:MAG TPA: hypothetical protein VM325_08000 [Alphaproteobacteria bacterium]|nr:hypothetical protein [Alphaproteobacteria bacterium]
MVRGLAKVAMTAVLMAGLLVQPVAGAMAEARKDAPKDPFDGRLKVSGNVGLEGRLFTQSPLHASQKRATVSLDGEVEFVYRFESGDRFTFKPFLRLDSADERRTHWDIREAAFLLRLPGDVELRAGVSKVFWGVAESNHLIDIINQTDSVEGPDGEEKLGQPMVMLTLARDWGTLDLFVLPWFRERTFPGRSGRLRPTLYIDTRKTRYESSLEERHPDVAVRFNKTIGKLDFDVAYFYGTSRDPALLPTLRPSTGEIVLVPFYPLIHQASVAAQYTTGPWLLKFEGLYRNGQPDARGIRDDYVAAVAGFEYTFYSIFKTKSDLGVLAEFLYDQRGRNAATPFQKDIFVGLRWTANDAEDTTVLAGVVQDLDEGGTRGIFVEASRRLSGQLKLELEARFFNSRTPRNIFFGLRRDDYVQAKLVYSF